MEFRFPAADGTDLEGVIVAPNEATTPRGLAVVCHPHPQFGGSMDTWMPPVLQRALADDGWTALRFNFRGVGLSEGCWIIGTRDQLSSADEVRAAAAPAGDRATVEVIDGDHFLLGRGDDLGRLIVGHARQL